MEYIRNNVYQYHFNLHYLNVLANQFLLIRYDHPSKGLLWQPILYKHDPAVTIYATILLSDYFNFILQLVIYRKVQRPGEKTQVYYST